jgi:hypothetical protein
MPVILDNGQELLYQEINMMLFLYIFSFVLIVNWTLLQVSVAVLLDNFVTETSREKNEKLSLALSEERAKDSVGNVLDPLLQTLSNEYVDDAQLEQQLKALFHGLLRAAEQTHELSSQVNIVNILDL